MTSSTGSQTNARVTQILGLARDRLRRHHLIEAVTGVALIFAVALGAALALAAAGPWSGAALVIVASLIGAGAIFWIVRSAWLPLARLRSEDAVALHLERHFPLLKSRLISAVQLERDLPELMTRPRFSTELVRALIEDATAASRDLDVAAAVPRGTWRRSLLLILLVGGLVGTVAAVAPDGLRQAWSNLGGGRTSDALAAASSLESPPPLVGDLTLRYQYPEYTRYPPRTVPSGSGEISAVKGTVVEVSAVAMVPVRKAELLVSGRVVPLKVHGRRLVGSLTVIEPGTYRFFLVGEDGIRRTASPEMTIAVETDRNPRVRILAPGKEIILGERGQLHVRYGATDDFGLRNLSLVYRVQGPGAEDRVRLLKTLPRPLRTLDGAFSLSVFDLGLRPGEKIAYRLRVEDNDRVSGPKRGESAVHFLKVYSPRERHLELLDEEKKVWDLLVHQLGDEIVLGEEATGADAPALGRAVAQARRVAGRSTTVQGALDRLLGHVREDRLFSPRARATLEGLRRRLRRRATREARWLTGTVGAPRGRLRRLAAFMPRIVKGMEQDVLLLEKLFKQQKLEALKELTRELMASQQRLRELLEDYRRTRDPALKAEIEREIARLRDKLRELRAKLSELFEASDEFVNVDALKPGRLKEAVDKMQKALAKGDLEGALRELEQMTQELQSTLKQVDLSAKAFYASAFYQSQKRMEKLLDDVHELQTAQKAVEKETRAVERAARSRAAKTLDVGRSGAAKRIQQRLEGIAKRAAEARDSLYSRWNRDLAERSRARAAEAAQALGGGDAAEALDMAKRGHGKLRQLADNLKRGRPWGLEPAGPQRTAAERQARAARSSMGSVVKDLEKLVPQAREALSAEERKQLTQLGKRQQKLRQRAGQLKRKLEKAQQQLPFVGDDAKKSLDEAHEQMGRAEERLGRGRPRQAAAREELAGQALGRLQQKLQQATRPKPSPSGGKEGEKEEEGRGMARQKVKIPGKEEHRSPREFREDLLEAMKQGTPSQYRDLVRRYYEELVR